jgi:hypothetical protein
MKNKIKYNPVCCFSASKSLNILDSCFWKNTSRFFCCVRTGIGLGVLYATLLGDGRDSNQAWMSIHHEDAASVPLAADNVRGKWKAVGKMSMAFLKDR